MKYVSRMVFEGRDNPYLNSITVLFDIIHTLYWSGIHLPELSIIFNIKTHPLPLTTWNSLPLLWPVVQNNVTIHCVCISCVYVLHQEFITLDKIINNSWYAYTFPVTTHSSLHGPVHSFAPHGLRILIICNLLALPNMLNMLWSILTCWSTQRTHNTGTVEYIEPSTWYLYWSKLTPVNTKFTMHNHVHYIFRWCSKYNSGLCGRYPTVNIVVIQDMYYTPSGRQWYNKHVHVLTHVQPCSPPHLA